MKNAIVGLENNLKYIHQRVKQQYKVRIYPRLWGKNIKIMTKIRKLEDQPMKANIRIITIPDKRKRENREKKSSFGEFKISQRQREHKFPDCKFPPVAPKYPVMKFQSNKI